MLQPPQAFWKGRGPAGGCFGAWNTWLRSCFNWSRNWPQRSDALFAASIPANLFCGTLGTFTWPHRPKQTGAVNRLVQVPQFGRQFHCTVGVRRVRLSAFGSPSASRSPCKQRESVGIIWCISCGQVTFSCITNSASPVASLQPKQRQTKAVLELEQPSEMRTSS